MILLLLDTDYIGEGGKVGEEEEDKGTTDSLGLVRV